MARRATGLKGLNTNSNASEWREHWPVVVASQFGIALLSIYVYSIGVMIEPIEAELGWTRAEISSGPTIVAVIGCLAAPFMGAAIDRFGARRIAIPGVILICTTMALLSLATSSIWSWWLLWFLVAMAHPFVKPTVWIAAVSSVFSGARGFALAVALCGTSISSTITPILTTYLIDAFGWRVAYALTGAIWLVVALPLVYFGFFSAKDKGRVRQAVAVVQREDTHSSFPYEDIRTAKFIKMSAAAALVGMCSVAVTVNLVPILSADGIERSTGAWIAGLAGAAGFLGKLGGGFLIDHLPAGRVVGAMTMLPAISTLLLTAFAGSIVHAIVAVALLAFSLGVEFDGVAYLVTRHFRLNCFGAIYTNLH